MHRVWSMFALLNLCVLAGCTPREVLKLHYLPGLVPGTRAIFLPANLAVAPVGGGDLVSGNHDVGNIYNSSGNVEERLQMFDAGATLRDALMTGLADAGLKPAALDSRIDPKDLKPGVDEMLSCDLQQLEVDKRFGAQQTIHGEYFTMTSRVKLKYRLQRRDGAVVYDNEITGVEEEPPKPVGAEVFFPLETDPAESLSVAMSRAIGALLDDPKFRDAFPQRTTP